MSKIGKVPNSYVYTSHTGSEYVYLDGSWINCSTAKVVDKSKNFKMNESALRQINEHNSTNKMKIGSTYIINESTYTYIGDNKVTFNGNLLNENINGKIISLIEADTKEKFSNFKRADIDSNEIPNGFMLDDWYYNKSSNSWSEHGKTTQDKEFSKSLNSEALEKIKEYNKRDDYPVNSTIEFNGKTYTWTGLGWNLPGKGTAKDPFTNQINDYLERNPELNKSDNSSEDSTSSSSSTDNGENKKLNVPPLVKDKSYIRDKHGQLFFYDGADSFINASGQKIDPVIAKRSIDYHKDPVNNGHKEPTKMTHDWMYGTNKDKKDQPQQEMPADAPKDAQPENEESSTNVDVPNGFIYTSGKGKSYVKKNGSWIDTSTKKPINSSAVPSLERAAQGKIEKHNDQAAVKIGQEWTSKKGVTYQYAGGNRFISKDGKVLPTDTARQVMQKLWDDSDKENGRGQYAEQPQQQQEPEVQNGQQNSPNQSQPQQQPQSNEMSPLQGLADQIKSNSQAPRIKVLIARGDVVSLLAADILLSGTQKEATQILKSLNS